MSIQSKDTTFTIAKANIALENRKQGPPRKSHEVNDSNNAPEPPQTVHATPASKAPSQLKKKRTKSATVTIDSDSDTESDDSDNSDDSDDSNDKALFQSPFKTTTKQQQRENAGKEEKKKSPNLQRKIVASKVSRN